MSSIRVINTPAIEQGTASAVAIPDIPKKEKIDTLRESKSKTKSGTIKRYLKYFFSKPKSKLEVCYRLGRGAIIAYALAKTPATWVYLEKAASTDAIGLLPRANAAYNVTSQNNPNPFPNLVIDHGGRARHVHHMDNPNPFPNLVIDSTAQNVGLDSVEAAITQESLQGELKKTDLNYNGIVLENEPEISALIQILKNKLNTVNKEERKKVLVQAINDLNNLNLLNHNLWGDDGLTVHDVHQVGGNCQIVADLLGGTFTDENIQKLKSLIYVTNFTGDRNLYLNPYYINSVVNLNGRFVSVPYEELSNYRGARDPSAPDGPYILSYAIEKELKENYIPNPYGLSSSSTTLITRRDYTMIFTPILSNSSIIKLLQQAPNKIIKAGTYPLKSDYISRAKELLRIEGSYKSEEIFDAKIIPYHEYAVKSCRQEKGEYLITLVATDPNNDRTTEITLTLDEFRNNFLTISATTESINLIDEETLKSYVIVLIALLALRKGYNLLEKRKDKKAKLSLA